MIVGETSVGEIIVGEVIVGEVNATPFDCIFGITSENVIFLRL